uniref:Protein tyrosine phosphatase n=1 Tax=Panagrolaimus superbus TaxID=310955 RepID=A0A914Z0Y6_9BILA
MADKNNHHVQINVKDKFIAALCGKSGKDYQEEWANMKVEDNLKCSKWEKFKDATSINRQVLICQLITILYANITCNDNCLVNVRGIPFFNGNFVKTPNGHKLFVATQAPTNDSAEAFWQLVTQENITVIVMLCQIFEPNTKEELIQKSTPYWPINAPLKYKNFEIHVKNVRGQMYADGEEAIMFTKHEIVDGKSKKVIRSVVHLQHKSWPDFGVPGTTESTMDIYNKFVVPSIEKKQPVLVHCSAGIGRTGSFIGGFYCYNLFQQGQLVSVENALRTLRKMRAHSVQTAGQYLFVNLILMQFIENEEHQYNVKEAKDKLQKLLKILDKKAKKQPKAK